MSPLTRVALFYMQMLRNHDVKSIKVDSTDVYGIGALLYHILTLERPWLDHLDVREAFRNPKRRGVRRAILKAVSIHIINQPFAWANNLY